jgi:methylated-DNA-protein-cysteine methyltransferase-like protein
VGDGMDTFPKRVYQLVSKLPSGKVSTYGQLALLAGSPRAARIVGAALRNAPPGLPCHRVLYRDGSLCCDQAFGGKEVQRGLLEKEGIPFLPDGRVDLKCCLWDPTEEDLIF